MAEHGEFSKRAFLNGRIDLSQAEAISDLITANNDQAAKLALKGIQGNITNFIKDLKEDLIKIITQIEVNIDYPEYEDIEELTAEKLLPGSVSLRKKMDDILDRSKNMHLIKDGISTVIVGKPNVGKSSLLNALLEEDKAIVTDIAGTTRDVVEGSIRLNDIVLNMIDTAGTICHAADALAEAGATAVYASCTHPVLSGPAIDNISKSAIKKLVVLDTIEIAEDRLIDKIEHISTAELLAEAIIRIHEKRPLSPLFETSRG